MTESPQPDHSDDHVKIAMEIVRGGAEDGESVAHRLRESGAQTAKLTYAELVELWHHQHNVAMHKERLYAPSSLAVLVGTILGWRDLTTTVVALAAVASIGLHWYLVLIMEDFAARQDRFFTQMQLYRVDILRVMFDESKLRFGAGQQLLGPPTVQRRLRRPFAATLVGVWIFLILIKAGVFR